MNNGLKVIALSAVIGICTVQVAGQTSSEPAGFNELYSTHNESVPGTCSPLQEGAIPPYIDGTFIIPSLGQFEMGKTKFNGLLDGFGKLQRFTVSHNVICFSAKMMNTGFYTESMKMNKVAPSMLFMKTSPPRDETGFMANARGPNDNTFVNSYELDGEYRMITDAQNQLTFDPMTLNITGKVKWEDSLDNLVLPLGSAHPLSEPDDTGCVLDVHPTQGMVLQRKYTSVYRLCPGKINTRVEINRYYSKFMPYFHSWGLTQKHVVLPIMHFTLNILGVIASGKPMAAAFSETEVGVNSTTLAVLPLDGSTPIEFTVPEVFYFTHVINTYENATSIIFDFVHWTNNPFTTAAILATYRNSTSRNNMGDRGTPSRLVMHLSGTMKGTANVATIPGFENSKTSTDFTAINYNFNTKKYCIFYGVQWYYDERVYANMAIVKHNICTGEQKFWHEDNSYPSEAKFIASPKGLAEDDGTLVFTVFDGTTLKSRLQMVDARTMSTVGRSADVSAVGFTTHGEYYAGLK